MCETKVFALCALKVHPQALSQISLSSLSDFPFQVLINQSSHSSPSMKLYIFQPQLISVSMKSG